MDPTQRGLDPTRVTKPIQLLAAWLAGLILINGSLLATAARIEIPTWGPALLVIAAVVNVPLFLVCLFLMQTRFRPEMQEDEYYARYLEKRYSAETAKTEVVAVKGGAMDSSAPAFEALVARIDKLVETRESAALEPEPRQSRRRQVSISPTRVSLNDLVPHASEILSALGEETINVQDIFGSTNDKPHVPEKFLLTFGEGAEVPVIQKVLRITKDKGLNLIGLVKGPDKDTFRRIYIGSYAFENPQNTYKEVVPELVEAILAPDMTMPKLKKLIAV